MISLLARQRESEGCLRGVEDVAPYKVTPRLTCSSASGESVAKVKNQQKSKTGHLAMTCFLFLCKVFAELFSKSDRVPFRVLLHRESTEGEGRDVRKRDGVAREGGGHVHGVRDLGVVLIQYERGGENRVGEAMK